MCQVNKKTKKKSFTGFKAVIVVDGHFYSPSTGLKYIVGMKIPKLKKLRKNADRDWANVLGRFYSEKMQGKTGVFKNLKDLQYQFSSNDLYSVIKMTVGGDLYEGKMSDQWDTIIGTEILSMELTKHKSNRR